MSSTPDWATLQAVAGQRGRGSFGIAVGNGIKTPRLTMWVTAFEDRVRVKIIGLMGTPKRWTVEEVQSIVTDLGTYLKELAELVTAQPQTEQDSPRAERTKSDTECWAVTFVLLGEPARTDPFLHVLKQRPPVDWRESLDG